MGTNSTVKTAVQMNIAASERKWEDPNTLWIHCNKNIGLQAELLPSHWHV